MADAPRIRLEQLLPACLQGSWSADKLAEEAGVSIPTARRFLRETHEEVSMMNRTQIIGITAGMWTVLAERAILDRDALAELNAAQRRGEVVPDKLVSSVVKRLIAVLNIGRSLAPRQPDDERHAKGLAVMNSTV